MAEVEMAIEFICISGNHCSSFDLKNINILHQTMVDVASIHTDLDSS
jgi:hypothetical protein